MQVHSGVVIDHVASVLFSILKKSKKKQVKCNEYKTNALDLKYALNIKDKRLTNDKILTRCARQTSQAARVRAEHSVLEPYVVT